MPAFCPDQPCGGYGSHQQHDPQIRALVTVFGQEQYAQIPMAVVGIVMKFFQIVISIVVAWLCIRGGFNMGKKCV